MPTPVKNPPNPWAKHEVEWLDEPPLVKLEVFEEQAKSVLSENKSPDLHFRYSVNPYRGCLHACAYCYARPSHQYLGFGAGTDFDRKIVVKTNTPEVLAKQLDSKSWQRDTVVFSGNTDCYQGLEASYRLTRRCLEVCLERRVPVSIITKSALVARDADILTELARHSLCEVNVSIAFDDDEDARRVEPWASKPSRRFEAIKVLTAAGVPVGVGLAPLIPGINDDAIPRILARSKAAGATRAWMTLLRLPGEVEQVFLERVDEAFPLRAERVRRAINEMRGGDRKDETRFGKRFTGRGPRWDAAEQLFRIHATRLGLMGGHVGEEMPFIRPENSEPAPAPRGRQLKLF